MTIKKRWLDGSEASFQKSFRRLGDWMSVSNEASHWLSEKVGKCQEKKHLFLFLSDSNPLADTKLNRYRKISKNPLFRDCVENATIYTECVEESENGLLFWCVAALDHGISPGLINHLRSDRGSFLFLADHPSEYKNVFADIMRLRADGVRNAIDTPDVVYSLLKNDLNPIRIWGQFDDLELWIEIYSQEFLLKFSHESSL